LDFEKSGLGDSLEIFASDSALRVLVLTASGDRSFCAGTDLKAKAAGEMENIELLAVFEIIGAHGQLLRPPTTGEAADDDSLPDARRDDALAYSRDDSRHLTPRSIGARRGRVWCLS
jgi:enoyl-CoA hydratase/carnithine racemase